MTESSNAPKYRSRSPPARSATCSACPCPPWTGARACRRCGTGSTCSTGPAQADLGPDGHPGPRHAARSPGPGPPPHVGGRPRPDQRAAALRLASDEADPRPHGDREGRPQRPPDLRDGRRTRSCRTARSSWTRSRTSSTAARPRPRRASRAAREAAPSPWSPPATGEREIEVSPTLAVPLLRADLQRAPHPLRPGLLPRRRGLPRPAHPRPAAGHRHGGGRPRGRPAPGTCPSSTAWSRRCSTTRA